MKLSDLFGRIIDLHSDTIPCVSVADMKSFTLFGIGCISLSSATKDGTLASSVGQALVSIVLLSHIGGEEYHLDADISDNKDFGQTTDESIIRMLKYWPNLGKPKKGDAAKNVAIMAILTSLISIAISNGFTIYECVTAYHIRAIEGRE